MRKPPLPQEIPASQAAVEDALHAGGAVALQPCQRPRDCLPLGDPVLPLLLPPSLGVLLTLELWAKGTQGLLLELPVAS